MPEAKPGDTVKVDYTGRLNDGRVFDSTLGREPLQFTIGSHEVIPGFEEAVIGMQPGDTKTVTIPWDQAYGPHYDEAVMVVDRSEFPEGLNPEVGDHLELTDPEGDVLLVTVTDANAETVTLDANHPLAGQDLTFDIKLDEISDSKIL